MPNILQPRISCLLFVFRFGIQAIGNSSSCGLVDYSQNIPGVGRSECRAALQSKYEACAVKAQTSNLTGILCCLPVRPQARVEK